MPRTKHTAVKYHHLRESVKLGTLCVTRVDTTEKLTDIFAKALTRNLLEYLRGKIIVWAAILYHGKMKEEHSKI